MPILDVNVGPNGPRLPAPPEPFDPSAYRFVGQDDLTAPNDLPGWWFPFDDEQATGMWCFDDLRHGGAPMHVRVYHEGRRIVAACGRGGEYGQGFLEGVLAAWYVWGAKKTKAQQPRW